MTIKEAISSLIAGKNLSENEMSSVIGEIMRGRAAEAQMAAFLTALRLKGETVEEIAGAARVLRKYAVKVRVRGDSIDTCGTGGSGKNIFNVSTASAIILAALGVRVVKHGNRAVSGSCGSADVLEELGVNIGLMPSEFEKAVKDTGIGFLFAPLYHSSMKHVAKTRRDVGIRTIFNLLGPLANPAKPSCQILGVYAKDLLLPFAKVLRKLGTKRAFVVHGQDGLDEITVTGPTYVAELSSGRIRRFSVSPEDFGVARYALGSLKGGGVKDNARIILNILKGKRSPKFYMTMINVSAALVLLKKAKSFKEGVRMAAEAVDAGLGMEKLDAFKKASRVGK